LNEAPVAAGETLWGFNYGLAGKVKKNIAFFLIGTDHEYVQWLFTGYVITVWWFELLFLIFLHRYFHQWRHGVEITVDLFHDDKI
jgi:hypothetical protein